MQDVNSDCITMQQVHTCSNHQATSLTQSERTNCFYRLILQLKFNLISILFTLHLYITLPEVIVC